MDGQWSAGTSMSTQLLSSPRKKPWVRALSSALVTASGLRPLHTPINPSIAQSSSSSVSESVGADG